jgi:hypothetical protein
LKNKTHSKRLQSFDGLTYWSELAQQEAAQGYIIYAGTETQQWPYGTVLSWKNTADVITQR